MLKLTVNGFFPYARQVVTALENIPQSLPFCCCCAFTLLRIDLGEQFDFSVSDFLLIAHELHNQEMLFLVILLYLR